MGHPHDSKIENAPRQNRLHATRYVRERAAAWDSFVRGSRNGTFLFERGYMDYHAERLQDWSLEVTDEAGATVALLPAERSGPLLRSHGGLTYGGFIVGPDMNARLMSDVFAAVRSTLVLDGIDTVVYKTVPRIYHQAPTDEDLYWLFRYRADVVRRDVLSVIERGHELPLQHRRIRSLARARAAGIHVRESRDYAAFWKMLEANLRSRYGVAPVHSLGEIELLATRFPHNIRLIAAHDSSAMIAGAVVYDSSRVCHVQYNAADERGRKVGGLDLVIEHLLTDTGPRRFLDLGSCTERDGVYLNDGLVEYKESFGARTIAHDMYRWDLRVSRRES